MPITAVLEEAGELERRAKMIPMSQTWNLVPPADHPLLQLEPAISLYRRDLEELIFATVARHGLISGDAGWARLRGTHLDELIARAYPLIRPDRLETMAAWFAWAFVIDDCFDGMAGRGRVKAAEVGARMLAAMPMGAPGAMSLGPLERALEQVWQGLSGQSIWWKMRYSIHMGHFLDAFEHEMANRIAEHTPPLSAYGPLRRASGGITPCLDLIEFAYAVDVPSLLHESEPLREMSNRAADVVVWVNDIISLPKELAVGETTNGVLAMAAERGLGMQDAIGAVYDRVAVDVQEFRRAERALLDLCRSWRGVSFAIPAVESYVAGLKAWMRGNFDWSCGTDRYAKADDLRLNTDLRVLGSRGDGWVSQLVR